MRILLSRAGRALPAAVAVLAAVTVLPVATAGAAVAAPVSRTAAADDDAPYIVTVHKDADPARVARMVGASPDYVYTTALHGFSARLSPGQVMALRAVPGVESIHEDGGVSSFGTAG